MKIAFLILCALAASGCASRRPAAPAPAAFPLARAPSEGFAIARPGRLLRFPRDHAAHPEYATEWWYYSGHLRDASGRWYGYQLTFFRVGVTPPAVKRASAWAVRNLYMAHLAVTDETAGQFQYAERLLRGSLGESGARTDTYSVHVADWSAFLAGRDHVLKAAQDGISLDLRATPLKPPAAHGAAGFSRKGAGTGRASYYYSYTRMATRGVLTLDGRRRKVAGDSWFDHEFGSNQLAPGQVGWDWFSLQLDDGTDVMLYLMRDAAGATDPNSSGSFVDPRGRTSHLRMRDFAVAVADHWRSPHSGGVYPSRWRVSIPSKGLEMEVEPTVADQELSASRGAEITYWEGSVQVKGRGNHGPIAGHGYVELTGYAGRMNEVF
ncbi:MAG TPA: lipocalin-like domain-containing protein [Armatimonadota bacterium]|jgi:predicted secreted hydrolase